MMKYMRRPDPSTPLRFAQDDREEKALRFAQNDGVEIGAAPYP